MVAFISFKRPFWVVQTVAEPLGYSLCGHVVGEKFCFFKLKTFLGRFLRHFKITRQSFWTKTLRCFLSLRLLRVFLDTTQRFVCEFVSHNSFVSLKRTTRDSFCESVSHKKTIQNSFCESLTKYFVVLSEHGLS